MNRTVLSSLAVVATLLPSCLAFGGSLDIQGDLNVSSNLTAQSVTLGGQTRSNWPSPGVGSAVDLGHSPVLTGERVGFHSIVLTNHAAWDFGAHAVGWQFKLKIAQDTVGGHTNVWPADLRWPGGQLPATTTQAGRWDVFEIVDDGTHWNAAVTGLNYRDPCVTNCSYALQFDGQNYVLTPSVGPRSSQSAATFEAWVRTTAVTSQRYFLTEQDVCWVGGNGGVVLSVYSDGRIQGFLGNCSAYQYFYSASPVTDGEWHHVALCVGPSTTTLFVDGTDQGTHNTPSFTTSGQSLLLGMRLDEGAKGWVGEIDEVRVSSVVRYTSNFTPAANWITDPDTIAYWRFNEGEGATAAEETGNHNGTLQGSPLPTWVEGK